MADISQLAVSYMRNPNDITYKALHKPLLDFIRSVLVYRKIDLTLAEHYQGIVVQTMLEKPFDDQKNIKNCIHTIIRRKWINELDRELKRPVIEQEYERITNHNIPIIDTDDIFDENGDLDTEVLAKRTGKTTKEIQDLCQKTKTKYKK